jgi:hypothetical protein
VILSSSFCNFCFACSFFSISALTRDSGALETNASLSNFLSNIAIYSLVSEICSFSLSVSFSTSRALAVSINTSTQALITQYAKLSSFGLVSTSSKVSAFTIPAITSITSHITSAFLFLAYTCKPIVLFGIILLSALRDLISLIISIINFLSFSI